MLLTNDIAFLPDRWSRFLQKQVPATTDMGLLTGMAFYFLDEYQHEGNPAVKETLLNLVERVASGFDKQESAFLGIQLTEFCHLLTCGWPLLSRYLELETLRDQLEALISDQAMALIRQRRYDPYTGAFFQAYYFLLSNRNSTLTHTCLSVLEQETRWISDECAYFDSGFSENRLCLGITHGLAFYITYLCQLLSQNIEKQRATPLLRAYSNFLIGHANFSPKTQSYFPDYAGEENSERLCLCYGDTGILLSLLKAFHWTGDIRNYQRVEEMLLQTTTRITNSTTGVRDASLLYGSAGLSLFYDRIFSLTEIATFRKAASYWREQAIQQSVDQYEQLTNGTAQLKRAISLQEGLTGALAICRQPKRSGPEMLDLFFYLK